LTQTTSDFSSGNDLPTSDFRPPTSPAATISSSAEAAAPTRARILDPAAIERKLALNTYNVDASRAHIRIIDHDVCLHCVRQQCINCCPANCYVPADDGRVIFSYEGCVECGTCRIVCHEFRNIEWTYPRGGFGIQYRYG
jgi:ferredoxin like protein